MDEARRKQQPVVLLGDDLNQQRCVRSMPNDLHRADLASCTTRNLCPMFESTPRPVSLRFIAGQLLCLVPLAVATFAQPTPQQSFRQQVEPILRENCYKCHSHSAEKIKAGLLLDSRAGMLEGGDSGTAIVPGAPEKSLLINAIAYTNDDLQMPRRKSFLRRKSRR
jgi:hypothetical protein